MIIKKGVVKEGESPCVNTGKPSEVVVAGEPCLKKEARAVLDCRRKWDMCVDELGFIDPQPRFK